MFESKNTLPVKKCLIGVRVTEDEKRYIDKYAKENGYSSNSELIREILQGYFQVDMEIK